MKLNGAYVKGILMIKGYKAWQIAQILNISESYFSFCVRGKRKVKKELVDKIAKILGVRAEDLLMQSSMAPGGLIKGGPGGPPPGRPPNKGRKGDV